MHFTLLLHSNERNIFLPCRSNHSDKIDIHDLGVILLEVITGRPITCQKEADIMKIQVKRNDYIGFSFSSPLALHSPILTLHSDVNMGGA